jgi:molybdopterin/thiamine biosynthesis adenylyltransferase
MKGNIYIIGCGGVGSWLVPALTLLTSPKLITMIDGDTLESKNLDRQLFNQKDVGRNKADALAERYQCQSRPEWFCEGLLEFRQSDWIIVCVDNHAARRAALGECDRHECRAIFAANETHSAEAYYYESAWKETKIDPRVYFPDILTDHSGDPRSRSAGCTGEAQKANLQLVTSNSLAASLAGHLFALWHLKADKFSEKTRGSLPYRLVANMTKLETFKISDALKTTEPETEMKGQQDE